MTVFFDEVIQYNRPLIQASIMKAFNELNVDLSEKKSAFIKVNIVRPAKPNSCVVTHPIVVEALIYALREMGVYQIKVGDGPAIGVDVKTAFKRSGYLHLAQKMNVQLINLNNTKYVKKEWDNGILELPLEIIKSDFYINVPKMKTHFHTGITLSIKNQQGLLVPQAKRENHCKYDLHRSLVSIAKVIQPDLVIVDAIHSMEGEGPTKGKKKVTKVMVYGENMIETDMACCHFMGVSPSKIEHLCNAVQERLGPNEAKVKGDAFVQRKTCFEMPSPKPKQILNFYSWKNYNACAEDEHSFDKAINLALRNPKYWFTFFPKFLYFVLFKRFDLLRGKNAKVPVNAGRILCLGNCCKDVANENSTYFVPGCPPKPEDILKTISRMK